MKSYSNFSDSLIALIFKWNFTPRNLESTFKIKLTNSQSKSRRKGTRINEENLVKRKTGSNNKDNSRILTNRVGASNVIRVILSFALTDECTAGRRNSRDDRRSFWPS